MILKRALPRNFPTINLTLKLFILFKIKIRKTKKNNIKEATIAKISNPKPLNITCYLYFN